MPVPELASRPSFLQPPRRVVSLVPSMTESLFELGLGDAVVAITDYCAHPAEQLRGLPRIGGPKNPRLADILDLKPDLVIANQEENTRQSIEGLQAAGVTVWLTFPKTVRQALDVLRDLCEIFHHPYAVERLQSLEMAVEWARSAAATRTSVRTFCPIWQSDPEEHPGWWMTFNRHTYPHDVLRIMGGENIFADRERRYPLAADLGSTPAQEPGERDTRYPRVTLAELQSAAPELILLPSEPFSYQDSHQERLEELLADTPAIRTRQVYRVDGSLLTWHGTRLGLAVQELPPLFQRSLRSS